jgi:predicted O-linked N-acetylglucosamine transferase (SPINDLY family)
MRLLGQVPGSVFWLLEGSAAATRNLRREASSRGIDPARLIFAPLAEQAEHLARIQLADLFLDTLPINAHTTASDALWAGVPVLTCKGDTFAGRVAASVLQAVGLPELISDTLEAYEEMALRLALTPQLLRDVRAKLARNRDTEPLFNTELYCRSLEAAYLEMCQRYQRGEAPGSFAVPIP